VIPISTLHTSALDDCDQKDSPASSRPRIGARLAHRLARLAAWFAGKWGFGGRERRPALELERRVRLRTAELEKANAALRDEIARRALSEHDLKQAKEAAESAALAKAAFLANMSHEIRTPINGVIGMANLLLTSPLNPEQRDLARTLCQSGEALVAIVNDILDFSKIEAGRLTLENTDFDLAEQLQLAIDLHADAAARKGVELIMDIDLVVPGGVRGDPVRLRQVVLNLIGNAIKFTPRGEVVLRVRLDRPGSGRSRLRFEVSDTGIGIPEHVQASLFQAFVQADPSTTRCFGGTGLGLAICKRLVELMGGEIGLHSAVGEGSTFWFTVELEHAADYLPEPEFAPLGLQGCRVLIVDDNATNRKLLDHLCAAWGMSRDVADSALSALTRLRCAARARAPFDLVILDHHMPDADGLDLARAILTDVTLPRPMMLMLTSWGERLRQGQMEASGISACEFKPIYPDKLRATLGRVLAASKGRGGPAAAPFALERIPPPAARSAAILIVEDNPVSRKVMLLQLRFLGYPADVVVNGREALAALQRKTYALVLMDQEMPEMDGLETARIIRRAQAAGELGFPRDLRIVATTEQAMTADREACLAAGMDDSLAKPVRTDELRTMLARFLTSAPAAFVGGAGRESLPKNGRTVGGEALAAPERN
jgi:signal transduction histidine kinase/CheY-like chemotaxis protein